VTNTSDSWDRKRMDSHRRDMGGNRLGLLIVGILLSQACLSGVFRPPPGPIAWACPQLPEAFQETDLVGAWQASYGAAKDTLLVMADGTYKQLYTRDSDGYAFESSWNRWWLERRASGGLYMHFGGMRRCDETDELCSRIEGGGGDLSWWDFCEDRLVMMPNEVILMITGAPEGEETAPKGIWLWHMSADPDSGSYHFELKEE